MITENTEEKTSPKICKITVSLCAVHIGCSDISDITMGIENSNHQILQKKYQL